ncbi:hypothetical protein KY314_03245 [Candidatus Woesearchaeota archaeon]|nr:hypothetical protein [Candidatus Woesearchaeota archaeon]
MDSKEKILIKRLKNKKKELTELKTEIGNIVNELIEVYKKRTNKNTDIKEYKKLVFEIYKEAGIIPKQKATN